MKKIISILLLATFCIFTQLHAQNRADELMKQAQENLTKKRIYQSPLSIPASLQCLCHARQVCPGSGMRRQCQRPLPSGELL